MSQPNSLYHWTNQIKSMFPNLSKPQAEVLAAFSFGIAKAKSRPFYAVARGLTFLVIPDTVETWLRRFISNPRVDMAKSCKRLARSVIRAMPRKKPVILLVDEGKSWRAKAKAFKNAGWIGRLGGAPSTVTATTSRSIWRRITRI